MHPVNSPRPGWWNWGKHTTTEDFIYHYGWWSETIEGLFDLLGPDGTTITKDACEDVDCLHPCYGQDQFGACTKCIEVYHDFEIRHEICDYCVI